MFFAAMPESGKPKCRLLRYRIQFATNGGWLGHTLKDFEEACKGAIVKPGLDVQFDESMLHTSEKDIQAWINTIRR